MTARNTASLPATNDFKPALNAREAFPILADKLIKVGQAAQRLGEVEPPEALAEANLTQFYNYINEFVDELAAWRAL